MLLFHYLGCDKVVTFKIYVPLSALTLTLAVALAAKILKNLAVQIRADQSLENLSLYLCPPLPLRFMRLFTEKQLQVASKLLILKLVLQNLNIDQHNSA